MYPMVEISMAWRVLLWVFHVEHALSRSLGMEGEREICEQDYNFCMFPEVFR